MALHELGAAQQQTRKEYPMPYKSEAQRRYFHAHKKELGAKVVEEFDQASKGLKLPAHVPAPPRPKASGRKR